MLVPLVVFAKPLTPYPAEDAVCPQTPELVPLVAVADPNTPIPLLDAL
jgi:hypothetical protein